MALRFKVGSEWREPNAAHVKVGGNWVKSKQVYVKKDGVWRTVWSDTFYVVVSSNIDDGYHLRNRAIAAGWDQASKLSVTINSGVRISKNGNDTMTIDGSFPRGVELHNYGQIIGKAGRGGNGGFSHGHAERGHDGWGGMTALAVGCPVTIFNHGIIAGGGGGGGGGSGAWSRGVSWPNGWARGAGGGGGGGRSNAHWSEPGAGGEASGGTNIRATSGNGGGWGSPDGPGGGGGGGWASWNPYGGDLAISHGGDGGLGGGWGQGGHGGGGARYGGSNSVDHQHPGWGNGGASGLAVYGNHHITWGATGERYGPIVNT